MDIDQVIVGGGGAVMIAACLVLMFSFPSAAQWVAGTFGAAGALVLGIPGVNPVWGFAAFLASNVGWLAFARANRHWGLFGQYLVFLVTSLVGVWNWWLGPLLLG